MGIRFPFGKGGKPRNPFTGGGNPFGKIKDTVKKEVIDEVRDELVKPLEKEIKKVEREVKNTAEDVFEEIIKAISSQAFKEFVKWIETFRPSSASLSLGPVSFGFDLDDKYDYVRGLVTLPPKNRGDIVRVIKTLAPEEITVSASVNLALGIGSKELGVGGSLTVPTNRFLDRVDSVL